jgi:TetR/AcrR family transcriptional regulator
MAPPPRRRRGRPAASDPGPADRDILDAALDAFATHGFAGTSVRSLARELGVSHNLLPQRFGSKERLWYAAVDQGFGALLSALTEVLDPPPASDLERLRALIERFVAANAARPALLRIIHAEASTPGPRLDHLYERYIDPVRQIGDAMLADLRARGEVSDVSVALVYFFMTHGAGGPLAFPALAARFGEPVDSNDPEAVARYAAAAVDVIFTGIARP